MPVCAKTLKGVVSLSWDNLTQTEITNDIENIREKIFGEKELVVRDKKEYKNEIKQYRKDKNIKENYIYANSGGGELSDRIVVPFFYKKYLYAYKRNFYNKKQGLPPAKCMTFILKMKLYFFL